MTQKLTKDEKSTPSSPDKSKGKHPVIPMAHYNLGLINLKMGNNQQALEYLKKAIESFIANFGEIDMHVSDTFEAIGETLYRMGIFKDSYDFLMKSYKIMLKIIEDLYSSEEESFDESKQVKLQVRLAFILDKMGIVAQMRANQKGEADDDDQEFWKEQAGLYFTQSLELKSEVFGDHPHTADTHFNLGKYYT